MLVRRAGEGGVIGVDGARLMFADVEALSAWRQEDSIHGLADVAFWGRDAAAAAEALDVPMLGTAGEDSVRGWRNLPTTRLSRRWWPSVPGSQAISNLPRDDERIRAAALRLLSIEAPRSKPLKGRAVWTPASSGT